ncbi:hypothetical protein M5D96_010452 [Drosophila gunungcola]|uniref:Uncharacterized protein n=1 Tax=Drosophila gunungcola TaxID=103775 RepID=A0A9Q0BLV7_9MUSC|nr:hypothetical protein M5D96_010452 [Drosophila gunungcola]
MLQGKLSIAHFLAVEVAIAGPVVGNKSSRFRTHSLFDDIRHWGEIALHILRIIARGRGGVEVESARASAIQHLATPAHLIAIAVVHVLDENTIRQDVTVAVRVHFIRARIIPYAVLRPRIEVHSRRAHTVVSLAIYAVIVPIAGVRVGSKSGGQSCARIAGQALYTARTLALLAFPVVEKSSSTGSTNWLPIDALNPRIAGPRIVHLGPIDHQFAYQGRVEGGGSRNQGDHEQTKK